MKIIKQATDAAVLAEIGQRFARLRLEKNLTQVQLAEQAGVSKSTVQRLESGDVSPQLSGFIRVCRVLDLIERFDLLVPEPVTSPVEQLKLDGRRRKRASAPKARKPSTKNGNGGMNHDSGGSKTLGTNHRRGLIGRWRPIRRFPM